MTSSRFPLSVVVIARNEAAGIQRCLQALDWCDDVVVIDDDSTDNTAGLAAANGARVLNHRFESFATQRNWALEYARLKHPWALMLDADEVVTPELRREIERVLSTIERDRNTEVVGFKMCRKTMFMGTWLKYSDGFPVWIVRLVKVGRFQFEDAGHGEVPVPSGCGKLATLSEPFLHYPFDKGLGHWVARHNGYALREAERELTECASFSWGDLWSDRSRQRQALRAISRRLPCRSVLRFLYQYVVKGGFLEGQAGLAFSWLMAFYEGLIVLKRREMELVRRAVPQSDRFINDEAQRHVAPLTIEPALKSHEACYGSR